MTAAPNPGARTLVAFIHESPWANDVHPDSRVVVLVTPGTDVEQWARDDAERRGAVPVDADTARLFSGRTLAYAVLSDTDAVDVHPWATSP